MALPLPLVPTERTAWIAAIAAPVALVLAAAAPQLWLAAPLAIAALLVLAVLDALLAGKPGACDLTVAGDAEVGEPLALRISCGAGTARLAQRIEAALEFDPRLGAGGKASLALECSE